MRGKNYNNYFEMSMNPSEEDMARWLDGELQGAELEEFEGWLAQQSNAFEYRQMKESTDAWKQQIREVIPREEDPPYPDFFNHRIQTAILKDYLAKPKALRGVSLWRRLVSPIFACSMVLLAFWLGSMQSHSANPEFGVEEAPKAIVVDPLIYTPEEGVSAEWVKDKKSGIKVVVMKGLPDIADDLEVEGVTENHSLEQR